MMRNYIEKGMNTYISKKWNIRFFTQWYLYFRGKKDAMRGTIKVDKDGYYTSPFMQQEKNLCICQIHKEKIILQQHMFEIDASVLESNAEIRKLEKQIKNFDSDNLIELSDFVFQSDEEYNKDFLKSIMAKENATQIATIDQRKNELNDAIEQNQSKRCEKIVLLQREIKIIELRCYQYFDMLRARLYVYWNGVLSSGADLPNIYPIYDEQFLNSVIIELNNIKEEVNDYEK